jgi:hypothetical protein
MQRLNSKQEGHYRLFKRFLRVVVVVAVHREFDCQAKHCKPDFEIHFPSILAACQLSPMLVESLRVATLDRF